jgi:hypothetical protein
MEKRDLRHLLATSWRATAIEPFFATSEAPPSLLAALPDDYMNVVCEFGGREGFLGPVYLRLYHLEELAELNFSYDVPAFFPEGIIFGSNGCGDAIAFPLGQASVVKVSFIPLIAECAQVCAPSFAEFIGQLAASNKSADANRAAVGMEVHEKHPIVFGGNPADAGNKVLVPVAKHAELCRFWNKAYRDARSRQPQQ